jgi:hypothetical protein
VTREERSESSDVELFFTSAMHGSRSLQDKEHILSHEELKMLICNIPGSLPRLPILLSPTDPRRPKNFAIRVCRYVDQSHPAKLCPSALFPPHSIVYQRDISSRVHVVKCCAFSISPIELRLLLYLYPMPTNALSRLMHKLKLSSLPLLFYKPSPRPAPRARILTLTHR